MPENAGWRPDGFVTHPFTVFVARVAKVAMEVASGETDKDGGCACVVPFPLQAVEYFINLSHR